MRLLLVNGNTDEGITTALARSARGAVAPDTRIVAVTAPYGAAVLQSARDLEVAETALLEAVEQHGHGCDGVLVGVSLDLAVEALRRRMQVPIVGMTAAALAVAFRRTDHVGAITLGHAMAVEFQRRFGRERLLVEPVDTDPRAAADARTDPGVLLAQLGDAAQRLATRGAGIVLPIGATVAGLASSVVCSVPVLDCIGCAARELERQLRAPRGRAA